MSNIISSELNRLLKLAKNKRATLLISIANRDEMGDRYGYLNITDGQLTQASYGQLSGSQALQAIARLASPVVSYAAGVANPMPVAEADMDLPSIESVLGLRSAGRTQSEATGATNVMSVPWQNRLQTRLSLMLVLVTTVILVALAAYNVWQERNSLIAELGVLGTTIAEQLSDHLAVPMWDFDDDVVAGSIEAEMLDRNIDSIIVYGEDGEVFAARQRDAQGNVVEASSPDGAANNADLLSSSEQIIGQRGEEIVGRVDVHVTQSFVNEHVRRALWSEALEALLIDLAIFVVAFLALRTLFIRPILQLTAAADAISRGNQVALETDAKDEIGLLSRAVDRMQTSLKVAIERLKK